jgi:hypothetical protein
LLGFIDNSHAPFAKLANNLIMEFVLYREQPGHPPMFLQMKAKSSFRWLNQGQVTWRDTSLIGKAALRTALAIPSGIREASWTAEGSAAFPTPT